MRINSDDDHPMPARKSEDVSTEDSGKAQPEPTTVELAQELESNTKATEKTQVVDPISGKGSIVNDMA